MLFTEFITRLFTTDRSLIATPNNKHLQSFAFGFSFSSALHYKFSGGQWVQCGDDEIGWLIDGFCRPIRPTTINAFDFVRNKQTTATIASHRISGQFRNANVMFEAPSSSSPSPGNELNPCRTYDVQRAPWHPKKTNTKSIKISSTIQFLSNFHWKSHFHPNGRSSIPDVIHAIDQRAIINDILVLQWVRLRCGSKVRLSPTLHWFWQPHSHTASSKSYRTNHCSNSMQIITFSQLVWLTLQKARRRRCHAHTPTSNVSQSVPDELCAIDKWLGKPRQR